MTQRPVVVIVGVILMVTILVLIVGLYSMSGNISSRTTELNNTIVALQDSIASLHAAVDRLQDEAPGLGEYMTTFQLHMGKLWFAAHAANWGLADYELGELTETMEAAEALRAVKNNVNTATVLQSVRTDQLSRLQQALKQKNQQKFTSVYDQTVQTCNSCHRAVGYGSIAITKPTSPPVSNQSWKPAK